jgi:alpha-glucosidase (family GH31 glycosyl hydrolase)
MDWMVKLNLEQGLVSRHGWSVYDDSGSLVFDDEGWLQPRQAEEGALDLYFFGYGHDYLGCIQEFQKVSGQTPLLPRWALGNWWSRYYPYSEHELKHLMLEFKRHHPAFGMHRRHGLAYHRYRQRFQRLDRLYLE